MKLSSFFASLLPLALCLALLVRHGVAARAANAVHSAHAATIPAPNGSTTDLVAEVCKKSNHKDLCLSSLRSVPDVGSTHDISVLAITALRVAATNATDTAMHIQVLLNDTTLAPTVQQGLSDCADHYVDAVEQLDNSVAVLSVKAYGDVRTWVKMAIDDANACEAGFQKSATGRNVLSHRNLIFRQLCNNALGIVKLLKA